MIADYQLLSDLINNYADMASLLFMLLFTVFSQQFVSIIGALMYPYIH